MFNEFFKGSFHLSDEFSLSLVASLAESVIEFVFIDDNRTFIMLRFLIVQHSVIVVTMIHGIVVGLTTLVVVHVTTIILVVIVVLALILITSLILSGVSLVGTILVLVVSTLMRLLSLIAIVSTLLISTHIIVVILIMIVVLSVVTVIVIVLLLAIRVVGIKRGVSLEISLIELLLHLLDGELSRNLDLLNSWLSLDVWVLSLSARHEVNYRLHQLFLSD